MIPGSHAEKKKRRQNIVFRRTEMKRQSTQPPDVVEFSPHKKKNASHILPALEGTTTILASVVLMFVFFQNRVTRISPKQKGFLSPGPTPVLLRSDDEPRSDDTSASAIRQTAVFFCNIRFSKGCVFLEFSATQTIIFVAGRRRQPPLLSPCCQRSDSL